MNKTEFKDINTKTMEAAPIYYVIYSPNETAACGADYWSNASGWVVDHGDITFFSEAEKETFVLPHATGYDAKWVAVELTSAGVILDYPNEAPTYRLVSFGDFDEENHTVDSFGQPDDTFCFYATYQELIEKFHKGEALYDDVKIGAIEQIFFNHIPDLADTRNSSGPEIGKLFTSLYDLLSQSDDIRAEMALGFVAQGLAAYEGNDASWDNADKKKRLHPQFFEALESCAGQMQQAQKMFESDAEFCAALNQTENALTIADDEGLLRESGDYYAVFREDGGSKNPFITDIFEDRDGKYLIDSFSHETADERKRSCQAWGYTIINPRSPDAKSSVEVEYWDSVQYNPDSSESTCCSFQMELIDRRTRGNLDVGVSPSSGHLDDCLNALFEISRLPGSNDDLPCVHLHIGDTHRLSIFQRNQELVLRLGDDSERFENASIAYSGESCHSFQFKPATHSSGK